MTNRRDQYGRTVTGVTVGLGEHAMIRTRVLTAGLWAAVSGLAGCTSLPKETARPQAAEDVTDVAATVGQKTVVENVEPIHVSAVGLVYGLKDGTGSPATGEWRPVLERELRKKKVDPKKFLDDPNNTCSLVLVSALIPPGAKKGDPIDIDVVLPRGSKTTSLKGGILFECDLSTTELSGNVREAMARSGLDVGKTPAISTDTLLVGKTLLRAEGPLIAGNMVDVTKASVMPTVDPTGDGTSLEATTGATAGRVWGGGKMLESRPYFFVLNEQDRNPRTAMEIAARMNAIFQSPGDARNKVANAVTKEVVTVNVPATYRLNHQRFLMVSRQVPLMPIGMDSLYRKKLEHELLDPATCIAAAVKLEALGAESTRALQIGVQSPSPWVRFAASEALAYLGSTTGATELAKLAEDHPAFRSHALTALASLDDGVSTDRLVELMRHPDSGLRYGAFTALRSANEGHPELNGKRVNKSFWVHHVGRGSKDLVHLTSDQRAEVVLFGTPGELVPPFTLAVSRDFVVAAKADATAATVTHLISSAEGTKHVSREVPPNLHAILTMMGEMGGGYADAVELIRKADQAKVLAASVALDAVPRGIPVSQLAVLARTDENLERANLEVTRATTGSGVRDYDLPTDTSVARKPSAEDGPLNRSPGRIFGGKKHPSEVEPEPSKTAKVPEPDVDLARNPGRLFGSR